MLRKYLMPLLLMMSVLFISSAAAASGGGDDARQFVDTLGKRVLEVVNGSGDEGQKQAKLKQMFVDNVDIGWMGRFVLGRAWQQTTDDQRTRYQEAYKEYLLTRYTTNFADYTGSKYTITDVKNTGDGQYVITMQIKSPQNTNEQETVAGYRVRSENGQFRIIDIIVEGVSLITTERSEFSSVVQQKGIDGLISAIQAKTHGAASKK